MPKQIQSLKLIIQNVTVVTAAMVCALAAAVHAQQAAGPLEVVMAGKPARKTLALMTTQPARIEALEQAPIHSKIASYVGEVLVDFGDKVKKDQPLLKLLAPEIEAEVAQKRALVEEARARLLQAEAGAKAAEAAVNTANAKAVQAEAASERAKSDLARWQSEYSRIGQLVTGGSVNRQLADETQQKLGAAEAAMKEALAAIAAARALASQSQAEAAKAASDVTAAAAQVRVAEANLAQSAAMQGYLTIKAPFDGVVTSRRVDPGHFVQPATSAATPLLVVARSDKMRVFVAVPEMESAFVDLTDPVTLEVQSMRGAEFKGTVSRTSFALDADNRSLNTIIDIDNASGRLRPGLYATAKILLQEQKDALTLPAAAVVRQGKEAFCYRLIGGKATKTPIQLGIKVGDDFEVTGGLSDNDSVILNKATSLKDGQSVEVLKAETKK
jgi:RND family efflux transporter MFP subunit